MRLVNSITINSDAIGGVLIALNTMADVAYQKAEESRATGEDFRNIGRTLYDLREIIMLVSSDDYRGVVVLRKPTSEDVERSEA